MLKVDKNSSHALKRIFEDGKKIRIWKDKWLPTPTIHKPLLPKNNLQEETKVCELIDTAKNLCS